MRRNLVVNLCLVLWSLTSATIAQQANNEPKRRYVVAPPENFVLAIAAQPDSPLQIVNPKLLVGVDYGWGVSCQLRNQGTKPIRFLTLVTRMSYGAYATLRPSGRSGDRLIMPGQTVPCDEDDTDEIVPLTAALRDKLELRGPMKGVVVLMVESIKFADGTSYSDEATSKALLSYFQNLPEQPEK